MTARRIRRTVAILGGATALAAAQAAAQGSARADTGAASDTALAACDTPAVDASSWMQHSGVGFTIRLPDRADSVPGGGGKYGWRIDSAAFMVQVVPGSEDPAPPPSHLDCLDCTNSRTLAHCWVPAGAGRVVLYTAAAVGEATRLGRYAVTAALRMPNDSTVMLLGAAMTAGGLDTLVAAARTLRARR